MRYKNIKNLSNTSWTIIDNPGVMGTGVNLFKINFVSNETEYTSMRFEDGADSGVLFYDDTEIVRYPAGNWADDAYRVIDIKGGADATNPMLLSWLNKYAKNYTPTAQTADIVGALKNISQAISEGGGGGGGSPEGTSIKSTGVPAGKVLSADGEGGASWEDAGGNVESVNGQTGEVVLTKSDVGLGNVDNTSDADKPISTATQSALNNKQAKLVSGTNIKTINNTSILGSGNISISSGGSKGHVVSFMDYYGLFDDYDNVDANCIIATDSSTNPGRYPTVNFYVSLSEERAKAFIESMLDATDLTQYSLNDGEQFTIVVNPVGYGILDVDFPAIRGSATYIADSPTHYSRDELQVVCSDVHLDFLENMEKLTWTVIPMLGVCIGSGSETPGNTSFYVAGVYLNSPELIPFKANIEFGYA